LTQLLFIFSLTNWFINIKIHISRFVKIFNDENNSNQFNRYSDENIKYEPKYIKTANY